MKRNEIIVAILMIALGLIAPVVLPSVWTMVVSIFCYYAILTIGWNIIFGYTGLFSFGHVAFSAIGGYTSALLVEHLGLSPFLGLLAGGLSAGFAAVLVGLLILRVRGFYLCLVTWAFAEVVNVVLKAEHHITGGTGGFLASSFVSGPNAELVGYFIGVGLMALAFVVSALLYHSRWGLYLFAVRDDIDAAESMGVKTRFWKVFGFAFGCAWAGVAGVFYTHYFSLIDPSISGLDEMGKVCLIVIIGGLGTVYGPVLGAFFVIIVAEFLRGWVGGYSLLIFATVMILAVRFVRGGFMEIIQVISPRLRGKYLKLIGKSPLD